MSGNFLREYLSRPPEPAPLERPWRPIHIGPVGWRVQTSLSAEETKALRYLARGKRVLEVGAAYGYSAITMAEGGAVHVLSVDPHLDELPGSLRVMRQNLHVCGADDRVTIVLGYSQYALPALIACGARFDLVFIDGDHSAPAVETDLHLAMLLSTDVVFHDYGEVSCPGVKYSLDASGYKPTVVVGTLWIRSESGEL